MNAPLAPVLADLLAGAAQDAVEIAEAPGTKFLYLLGALIVAVGVGCLVAVLRVVLPGPTERADRVVQRLGTGRLLLTGVLPILAIALIGGVTEAGGQVAEVAFVLVLFLPAVGLTILGGMALIPHLGGRLLAHGEERSPITRAVVGSTALILALAASLLIPDGVGLFLLGILLLGWFFSAGLGATLRRRSPSPPEDPAAM